MIEKNTTLSKIFATSMGGMRASSHSTLEVITFMCNLFARKPQSIFFLLGFQFISEGFEVKSIVNFTA